jgi:hypothetical protein
MTHQEQENLTYVLTAWYWAISSAEGIEPLRMTHQEQENLTYLLTAWYWAISSAEGIETFAASSSLNTLKKASLKTSRINKVPNEIPQKLSEGKTETLWL